MTVVLRRNYCTVLYIYIELLLACTVYINDLPNVIFNCDLNLSADDMALYSYSNSVDDLSICLQKGLDLIKVYVSELPIY
jgi:hypothetical protein